MTRSRSFVYTLNNYTTEEVTLCKGLDATYHVFGYEVGESGTPHLQGLLYYKNGKEFNVVKRLLPRAHIEICRCLPSAIEYCKKDGEFYEKGRAPRQGQRTDIDNVRSLLDGGSGMRQIVEVADSYQSCRMGELFLKYKERKRNWKPTCVWFYGASGAGKTRKAMEEAEALVGQDDIYMTGGDNKWFDGYDAHKVVIVDDIRPGFMSFNDLLRLFDRYEMRVEHKGGSRQFLATHIFVTSPTHPKELFQAASDFENLDQLTRRFDRIEEIFF